jgi:hypothetical protein
LIFRINAGAGGAPSGPDTSVFMPRIFTSSFAWKERARCLRQALHRSNVCAVQTLRMSSLMTILSPSRIQPKRGVLGSYMRGER